ncbi:ribosomal protein S5, eukaryotic/archaeal [Kipferlia bialata]|uniref:Small ribosomal subunit protein uS5 n=1 Tax=Kipferlia bialata TaxID=797122 RepID=A0A391NI91_9EUKA|nr:ribosomal protein S5, eukaryotic/archaeal [Kipferlia bialata]|eukprot:g651.t1
MSEPTTTTAQTAEKPQESSGFRKGFKGQGRDKKKGGRRDEEVWTPSTKLGRLVKAGKVRSIEEIFLFSMPIKEHQIVDFFLPELEEEVLKVQSVQKQTRAGQRTRFRAMCLVGDRNGHIGYGVGIAKEVATAIRKSIHNAKQNITPVRMGYWGGRLGAPHTVICKLTGKCGSVSVRLVPAPRGSGIVASNIVRKVLEFAGVEDVFTSQTGHTKTLMNSALGCFRALQASYSLLTPDMWAQTAIRPDLKARFSEE